MIELNKTRLNQAKTKILIDNMWINTFALVVSIILMSIFYRQVYELPIYLVWIFVVTLILVARIVVVIKFDQKFKKDKFFNSLFYYKSYSLLSISIGILLAICLSYLSLRSNLFQKAFLICFTCGFVAASSFVYGAFKKLSASYSLILGASVLWSHKAMSSEWDLEIILFCFLFIGAMIKSMISLNQSMTKTILQSFEMEKLSMELEKKYEELTIKNKELKNEKEKVMHSSRLAAVGGMSGSIAHEINNPLSVILTASSSIERHIAKKSTPDPQFILDNVHKVTKMVDRMVKIIRSIKQYTRSDRDALQEVCCLGDIILETTNLAGDRIKQVKAKLSLNIPENKEFKIKGNYIQISQVLINLINNAMDEFELKANGEWINIDLLEKNNSLVVEVSNDGPKIPNDVAGKVFEQFYTTKEAGKGTGLGLSLSKDIIEQHNGNLEVLLDRKFTTFSISLPKAS